jgi:hypothetical protein
MATKTFNADNQFTAVSGCTVSSGVQVNAPLFSNATLDALSGNLIAAWKLNETTGTRSALVGPGLDGVGAAVGYATGISGNAATGSGGATTFLRTTTDLVAGKAKISVSAWVYFSSITNAQVIISEGYSGGARLSIQKDASHKLLVLIRDNTPTQKSTTSVNTFSAGQWYHVVVVVDTDADTINAWVNNTAWITDYAGATGAINSASGYGVSLAAYYTTSAAATLNGSIDEVYVWDTAIATSASYAAVTALYNSGAGTFYDYYGVFTVHDASADDIDLGESTGIDPSTATKTHTADAVITVEWAHNNTGETPESYDSYSWAEFLAADASPDRYHWFRLSLSHLATSSFTAFTLDTYSADTTPPAAPTATKYVIFDTDNFALNWDEPADEDFDHCELKRIADATTTYLGNNAGVVAWEASPGTYWQLRDGAGGAGITPHSAFVDETVTAASVAYYVRSVDATGNASAWALFASAATEADYPDVGDVRDGVTYGDDSYEGTLELPGVADVRDGVTYGSGGTEYEGTYVAGDAPSTPEISVEDNEDGTGSVVTVSETDDDATNTLYTAPVVYSGSPTWTTSGSRVGDGEIPVTLSTGFYWFVVISTAG